MNSKILQPTLVTLILLATPSAGLPEGPDSSQCQLAFQFELQPYLGRITDHRQQEYTFIADKMVKFEEIRDVPVYERLDGILKIVDYKQTTQQHKLDVPITLDVAWQQEYVDWTRRSVSVTVNLHAALDVLPVAPAIPVLACGDAPVYDGFNEFFQTLADADYWSLANQSDAWYHIADSLAVHGAVATPEEREQLDHDNPRDVAYEINQHRGYSIGRALVQAVDEVKPSHESLQALARGTQ